MSVSELPPGVDVKLYWYDSQILFYPVLPCLVKALTIKEKSLELSEQTNFVRDSILRKREMFERLDRGGKVIGTTFHGFIDRILQTLAINGLTYDDKDCRTAKSVGGRFPKPRLDLMKGFRFSQEDLITKALLRDQSGLIGAPTRYGKTTLMINTMRAFPESNICVVAPGVDLVKQLYEDITGPRGIKDREVKLICSGSKTKYMSYEHNGITVCSVDSLDKVDQGQVDLLLADEPHALVTQTRTSKIDKFFKARRYGYGATLDGRFDGRDALITGLFGPVLAERTYKEAVEEGAICPLHIIFFEVEITPNWYGDRTSAYNHLLFKNERMAKLTADLCKAVVPEDFQTMIFIKDEKQAELYLKHIGEEHTIAMAKRMNNKEREEVTERMRSNVIKRCLCTKIYVQGVTFSDVRVLINAEAGGDNTSAIQKPGRLAEVRPNKKCGVVFDFLFMPADPSNTFGMSGGWGALCYDSKARLNAYKRKGYDIHYVRTVEEAKAKFEELI